MSSETPSPRIFVIPATRCHTAVVFRRGPSDWYHLLRWDTAHDTFESGAWFRGRIYPNKCDLSPDGTLLLYFVHKGSLVGTSYSYAWSAVSRSPWLTALGLWPQGTTYGGGGRFVDDRSIVLRAAPASAHPDHPGRGLHVEFGNAPEHTSTSEIEDCDWSGRDSAGRLIFAMGGCLFRRSGAGKDRELVDLNGLLPDPQPAPPLAARPLILEQSNSGKRVPKSDEGQCAGGAWVGPRPYAEPA
jgi:hypothetical protein